MPIPPVTPHAPDEIWLSIRASAERAAREEPMLASFLHATILNHDTLEAALSFHLAQKLDSPAAPALLVREVIEEAFVSDPAIGEAIRCDLRAVNERDSACPNHAVAFLFFKGFHALESYRIAHWLWQQQRRPLALFLQNRISCEFGVDIHPAARFGGGIMLDQTVFYATAGGQPGDRGKIIWDGGECAVATTVYDEHKHVVHVPASGAAIPPIGARVTARLDWNNRYRNMRAHTLMHLLLSLIHI